MLYCILTTKQKDYILVLPLLPIAFKLVAAAIINDTGYEALVNTLKKIEGKDPTNISSKLLKFLSSDQDMPEGIIFKNKSDKENAIKFIAESNIDVKILDIEQIQKQFPDIETDKYDLVLLGKPRNIIEANNVIISMVENITALGNDQPMNTVFGRLYEVIRKKLSQPSSPKL